MQISTIAAVYGALTIGVLIGFTLAALINANRDTRAWDTRRLDFIEDHGISVVSQHIEGDLCWTVISDDGKCSFNEDGDVRRAIDVLMDLHSIGLEDES